MKNRPSPPTRKKGVKGKYLVGALCLLIAAVIAFGIVPGVYRQQAEMTTVVRAAVNIPADTLITEEQLEKVEMGVYNLPPDLLSDTKSAVGKYATADIYAGDFITPAKLSDLLGDELMTEAVSDGLYMVSVTLPSSASALATQIRPGDYLSVATYSQLTPEDIEWMITEDETGAQTVVPKEQDADYGVTLRPELAHLQVYTVNDGNGADATVTAAVPKSVTFLVTRTQAELLIKAEYTAKIHLIWVGRGTEAKGE